MRRANASTEHAPSPRRGPSRGREVAFHVSLPTASPSAVVGRPPRRASSGRAAAACRGASCRENAKRSSTKALGRQPATCARWREGEPLLPGVERLAGHRGGQALRPRRGCQTTNAGALPRPGAVEEGRPVEARRVLREVGRASRCCCALCTSPDSWRGWRAPGRAPSPGRRRGRRAPRRGDAGELEHRGHVLQVLRADTSFMRGDSST